LAACWPPAAEDARAALLAGAFDHGGCPKRPEIPDIVTAGLPTVGLRMPAHALALGADSRAGVPIAGPSANRFTELSPTAAGHVPESLPTMCWMAAPRAWASIHRTFLVEAPVLLRPG